MRFAHWKQKLQNDRKNLLILGLMLIFLIAIFGGGAFWIKKLNPFPKPQVSIWGMRVVNRPIQNGDTVLIDYEGKIQNTETQEWETFDGGSATEKELVIGSDEFIAGFEDGLIGAQAGIEPIQLNLNFPDDYSKPELAGKEVQFTVTIHEVRSMRE